MPGAGEEPPADEALAALERRLPAALVRPRPALLEGLLLLLGEQAQAAAAAGVRAVEDDGGALAAWGVLAEQAASLDVFARDEQGGIYALWQRPAAAQGDYPGSLTGVDDEVPVVYLAADGAVEVLGAVHDFCTLLVAGLGSPGRLDRASAVPAALDAGAAEEGLQALRAWAQRHQLAPCRRVPRALDLARIRCGDFYDWLTVAAPGRCRAVGALALERGDERLELPGAELCAEELQRLKESGWLPRALRLERPGPAGIERALALCPRIEVLDCGAAPVVDLGALRRCRHLRGLAIGVPASAASASGAAASDARPSADGHEAAPRVTLFNLWALAALPLERLALGNLRRMRELPELPRLRSLSLAGLGAPADLAALAESCPALEELALDAAPSGAAPADWRARLLVGAASAPDVPVARV